MKTYKHRQQEYRSLKAIVLTQLSRSLKYSVISLFRFGVWSPKVYEICLEREVLVNWVACFSWQNRVQNVWGKYTYTLRSQKKKKQEWPLIDSASCLSKDQGSFLVASRTFLKNISQAWWTKEDSENIVK